MEVARNESCRDLPGWAVIMPPPGGLGRLRDAIRQASTPEPTMWAMWLGGAVSAGVMVATLSLLSGVRQQSASVRSIVSEAQTYQQAARTFVSLAGDETSSVHVYVAVPMKTTEPDER